MAVLLLYYFVAACPPPVTRGVPRSHLPPGLGLGASPGLLERGLGGTARGKSGLWGEFGCETD